MSKKIRHLDEPVNNVSNVSNVNNYQRTSREVNPDFHTRNVLSEMIQDDRNKMRIRQELQLERELQQQLSQQQIRLTHGIRSKPGRTQESSHAMYPGDMLEKFTQSGIPIGNDVDVRNAIVATRKRMPRAPDTHAYIKEHFNSEDDVQTVVSRRSRDKSELGYRDITFIFDTIEGTNILPGVWRFQSETVSREFLDIDKLTNIVGMEIFEFYIPKFSVTLGMREVTVQLFGFEAQSIKSSTDIRVHFSFTLQDAGDRYQLVPKRSRFYFNSPLNFATEVQFRFLDPRSPVIFPPQQLTGRLIHGNPPTFRTDVYPHELSTSDIVSFNGITNSQKTLITHTYFTATVGAVNEFHQAIYYNYPSAASKNTAHYFHTSGTNILHNGAVLVGNGISDYAVSWQVAPNSIAQGATVNDVTVGYVQQQRHVLVGAITASGLTLRSVDLSNWTGAAPGTISVSPQLFLFTISGTCLDANIEPLNLVGSFQWYSVAAITAGSLEIALVSCNITTGALSSTGFSIVNLYVPDTVNSSSTRLENVKVTSVRIGELLVTVTARMKRYNMCPVAQVTRINDINTAPTITPGASPTEYLLSRYQWGRSKTNLNGLANVELRSVGSRGLLVYTTDAVINAVLFDVNQVTGILTPVQSSEVTLTNYMYDTAVLAGQAAPANATQAESIAMVDFYLERLIMGYSYDVINTEAIEKGYSTTLSSQVGDVLLGTTHNIDVYVINENEIMLVNSHQSSPLGIYQLFMQSLAISGNTISQVSYGQLAVTVDSLTSRIVPVTNSFEGFIITSFTNFASNIDFYTGQLVQNTFSTTDEYSIGLPITAVTDHTITVPNLSYSSSIPPGPTLLISNVVVTANILTRQMRIMIKFDTLVQGFTNGVAIVKL